MVPAHPDPMIFLRPANDEAGPRPVQPGRDPPPDGAPLLTGDLQSLLTQIDHARSLWAEMMEP